MPVQRLSQCSVGGRPQRGSSGAKICVHSESPSCTRWYNSSVAQRETYRVLDLDGDPTILTFGEFDGQTDAALVDEAEAVFNSIRFVSAP